MTRFSTRLTAAAGIAVVFATMHIIRVSAAADVILYASGASRNGNWAPVADSTAAGGNRISSTDNGWATPDGALASPSDYFELSFSADANTPYHVWVRLKAGSNSKYNDSVYLQFNDSTDGNGSSLYRVGTTSALTVNLQTCNGCTLSNWGWVDGAYWLSQASTIRFANGGTHTVRIQTREDGVSVDQIVLGAASYLNNAPGQSSGDSTIVPTSGTSGPTTSVSGGSSPFNGTPAAIPGTINAADYDRGGEGVAYHDSGPNSNAGGEYRNDGVDIESSSEGGYDVGWVAAGEWLNYTVNVASAGSYTAQLRVASTNGSTLHVGLNGSPSVWAAVSVSSTGGWQNWTTVSVPVTLGAGRQVLTLMFDSGGVNIRNVNFVSGSGSAPSAPSAPTATGPYGGSAASIPGKITAAYFDNGGEGAAYHDTSSGNNGGAVRSTDVDIESSSEGGSDVGWIAAGEYLNYTVNVTAGGNYTAQLRVASPNGGSLHLGFNGSSSVWSGVSIPATGDWQSWTTVNVPVTLGAGQQTMTLAFDSGGFNIAYVNVVTATSVTSPTTPPPPSSGGSGTTISAATWNIEINDGSEGHARTVIDNLMGIGPQPQIIAIQEAWASMFNVYKDELYRQTGQVWNGVFATHCASGDWNGSSCNRDWYQGVAIFTSFPINDSSSTMFAYADCWTSARAGLRASVNVNGINVQVFTTHLQTGGCTDDQSIRYASMSKLKSWAANYSKPQIAAGDFNADPDQIDTTSGMSPNFVDTWSVVGSGLGWTAFGPDPSMKIDYWFTDSGFRAQPIASHVSYWTGSVSDHYPVQTTFVIR